MGVVPQNSDKTTALKCWLFKSSLPKGEGADGADGLSSKSAFKRVKDVSSSGYHG